jgi:hypothetical protein
VGVRGLEPRTSSLSGMLSGALTLVGSLLACARLSAIVRRCLAISPVLVTHLVTQSSAARTADRPLTRSSQGAWPTAAILVRAGLLIVLVPLNVRGFWLVLARGWHATDCFVSKPSCHRSCQDYDLSDLRVSMHQCVLLSDDSTRAVTHLVTAVGRPGGGRTDQIRIARVQSWRRARLPI